MYANCARRGYITGEYYNFTAAIYNFTISRTFKNLFIESNRNKKRRDARPTKMDISDGGKKMETK